MHNSLKKISEAIQELKKTKPNDRSELDRRYAIAITELEKVWSIIYTLIDQDVIVD